MRYWIKSRFCLALPVLAVAGLAVATAHAGGKAEKLQFSEPTNSLASSNLTRLNPNARAMDEDLLKSFQSFKRGDSLDSIFDFQPPVVMPRQNQPRPLSRKALEQIDRRKNWAFTDLNDLSAQSSLDEMMGVRKTDILGNDESQLSAIEKYYQNAGKKNTESRASARNLANPVSDKINPAAKDFDPYASAFKTSDPFFRKLMTGESGDSEKNAADAGIFSSSVSPGPDAEMREQQRRLAVFRHEMDPSYPLPKSDNPYAFADSARQPQVPGSATNAANIFQHTSINPAPVGLDPTLRAFRSHVYDDPTATALGLPQRPLYQPEKPPTPPPTAQSTLSLIDPFSANAPKRKF